MKLTANVADDQAFYVKDGPKVSSVKELAEALENNSISDDSFSYHINNNNNDFLNWILDVYQNEKLVKSLRRVKAKPSFVKKLNEELKEEVKPAAKPSSKKAIKPAQKSVEKPVAKQIKKPAAKSVVKKKK